LYLSNKNKMACPDYTVSVTLITYPAKVQMAIRVIWECLFGKYHEKQVYSESHFSMYFFRFPKENSKTLERFLQEFLNNQVGDKVIIQLQNSIRICSICIYYFAKGAHNQRYNTKVNIVLMIFMKSYICILCSTPPSNL
jgi:hypothetical protein